MNYNADDFARVLKLAMLFCDAAALEEISVRTFDGRVLVASDICEAFADILGVPCGGRLYQSMLLGSLPEETSH